ncbi:unnamed protein product [Adineta steineri]|uniref:Uncharacterized protein n=1 Tax=Adineta steineri TaxID=433720 RepID=A0A815TC49_9BILA|nr:unnamed protein product [Adineta steineri]CAF4105389.1 unnamed protein product [Adineta steineri]
MLNENHILFAINALLNGFIEPARSIEDLVDGSFFLHLINKHGQLQSQSYCIPIFNTMTENFEFIVNYIRKYCTKTISRDDSFLIKVVFLIIYINFVDILISARIPAHHLYYNNLHEFFTVHAIYNDVTKMYQLNLESCYHHVNYQYTSNNTTEATLDMINLNYNISDDAVDNNQVGNAYRPKPDEQNHLLNEHFKMFAGRSAAA